MMTTPSELSFHCKHDFFSVPQKSFGDDQYSSEQNQKLEGFLARLEEERIKIDAFKRELPLCMQLLTNAMEASRQQLQFQRSNQLLARPILEEFIPLKNVTSKALNNQESNTITADKSNWMTSAQLWNQENEEVSDLHQETEIKLGINGGGAFLPFSPVSSCGEALPLPELGLAPSRKAEIMMEGHKKKSSDMSPRRENSGNKCGNGSCGGEKEQVSGTGNNTNQAHRKARRCWSPDLHRRFVNALHMLGGSQLATPKQIRELMKVDGLTNDEVKSHLQKYRLHTRRPSPSPQAAVTTAPQVVVLGGIWVPPEYAAVAAAHGGAPSSAALYGAHGGAATHHHITPPFCSAAAPPLGPQEIYPAIGPPPPASANPNYQVHHHQQVHLYSKPPLTQTNNSSPRSDIQGRGGDPRSESIEDGKSDSGCSWKADSGGENGGERRTGVGGEESNGGTVVSLKFRN